MSLNFELYVTKGNEVINRLAYELGTPKEQAARILKAVLHGLRDRLCLDENFDFLAQLPMVLKAIYVDGWKPRRSRKRSPHLNEFLDEIRTSDVPAAAYDFGNDQLAKTRVQQVFRVLSQYISAGELEDVMAGLPLEIKEFVQASMDEKHVHPYPMTDQFQVYS